MSAEEVAFGSGRSERSRMMRRGGGGRMDDGDGAGAGGVTKYGMSGRERDTEGDGEGESGGPETTIESQQPQPQQPQPTNGVIGLARKIWMGDERTGWQKRRLEREREELGKGRGYGDIIMGQVREVFPGFGGGGDGNGGAEGEGGEDDKGQEK